METKESDILMENRVLWILLGDMRGLTREQLTEKQLEAKRIWKIIKDDLDELVEGNITYKIGNDVREYIKKELNCYAKLHL